jgi:hypothetical protein
MARLIVVVPSGGGDALTDATSNESAGAVVCPYAMQHAKSARIARFIMEPPNG